YVKTALIASGLSRHREFGITWTALFRQQIERDRQSRLVRPAWKRHRSVPHVRREQDQQARLGTYEMLWRQRRAGRKRRLPELQPPGAIGSIYCPGQVDIAGRRHPSFGVMMVDVKAIRPQSHGPRALDPVATGVASTQRVASCTHRCHVAANRSVDCAGE